MSVLCWLMEHYKAVLFLVFCATLGGLYGYFDHKVGIAEKSAQEWQERAKNAESALSTMVEEKARLTAALEAQEEATAQAQANRKVVYRTIKEEVAKSETARDWYNTAIPPALAGVLQGNGTAGND